MRLVFVTFGDGSEDIRGAAKRICKQAEAMQVFDVVHNFSQKDLEEDEMWWKAHSSFILKNRRGFGYWLWKSYVIKKTMEKLDEGDIVFFSDCGSELCLSGKKRFLEYIEMVKKHDVLGMTNGLAEKTWTKMDLADHVGALSEHLESSQIQGNSLFFKKTEKNIEILNEWVQLCTADDYRFIDDSPSTKTLNDSSFVENRHDQSILSLLLKKNKCFTIPAETSMMRFHDWDFAQHFPIHTLRNKTPSSKLPSE